MTAAPRLETVGLTKRFPGVLANDAVDLSVAPGEIHALLGENGAGKSTFVKMLYGLLRPDAGEIRWNGSPVEIANPKAARTLGLAMVFQHFSLFDAMTVAENIALGAGDRAAGRRLEERIVEVMETYGLALDPKATVGQLSVGERQRIEIVRALLVEPKLLVMDEPTSVLTPQEVDRLFETLHRLRTHGCTVLYISHKLDEIRTLCERATVLRGGRVVATCDPEQETARSLAEMMIGTRVRDVVKAPAAPGAVRLAVDGLSLPPVGDRGTALKGIGFELRAGEILGIAGVAGNGQTELLRAVSGERLSAAHSVRIGGQPVGGLRPDARRALGLSTVPEDRSGHAAVPDFTLTENALLTARARMGFSFAGLTRQRRARSFAQQVIDRFGVRAQGPGATAASLSGGNLQKFIVGREILQAPDILAVNQPTWGVDAGAAAAIRQALVDLAGRGSAILLISQDLDELFELTDRLAVLSGGRLSPPRPTAETTTEAIGQLMGGLHGAADAA